MVTLMRNAKRVSLAGRDDPQLRASTSSKLSLVCGEHLSHDIMRNGLPPIALLSSRSSTRRPGLSIRALSRVSTRGDLLVEAAVAQIASLRHENYVVDELLLELHSVVQSRFHVLHSLLDTFSLEIPPYHGRVRLASGAADLLEDCRGPLHIAAAR